MRKNLDEFLWTEKYRPSRIEDVVLPKNLKKIFKSFVTDDKVPPNLLLSGRSGIGKTTVAKALMDEIGSRPMIINGSLDGNIDTLRNEITAYASSVSFDGKRKYVIIDEADYLTPMVQPALRNFMEEYSSNCGFILTCNYQNRIIPAIQSRCTVIDFNFSKSETAALAIEFIDRLKDILAEEKINYDEQAVVALVERSFPDWRKILNEAQSYSTNGSVDTGVLHGGSVGKFHELLECLREKNFTAARKWVGENLDNDQTSLFREFYDSASTHFAKSYIPELVLLIGKYQFQAAHGVDNEINFSAFLVEVMVGCEWK